MFDLQTMRDQLASTYDLAPNPDLAEQMSDLYQTMDRVVNPVDWARYAPYVAAINTLKKNAARSFWPTTT